MSSRNEPMNDPLVIAGVSFSSRLIAGTARYPNNQILLEALEASGAELVTASIRRISLDGYAESLVDLLGGVGQQPVAAEQIDEALETNWIKLELIGDRELLYPDV